MVDVLQIDDKGPMAAYYLWIDVELRLDVVHGLPEHLAHADGGDKGVGCSTGGKRSRQQSACRGWKPRAASEWCSVSLTAGLLFYGQEAYLFVRQFPIAVDTISEEGKGEFDITFVVDAPLSAHVGVEHIFIDGVGGCGIAHTEE